MGLRSLSLLASLFWLLCLLPAPLRAVVIHDQANNSAYYNVTSSQFNGIARLRLSGNNVCSAFAISSNQVLTAAHCIPSVNPGLSGLSIDGVQFSLLDNTVYAPTSVFVNPGFNFNNFQSGFDIAVLYFEQGLPAVNFYPIYQYGPGDSELGDSFELFGYGRCGSPTTGDSACTSQGLRRAANRFDHITPNGRLLEFDFDSYNTTTTNINGTDCRINNALCYVTGNSLPSKQNDPEIGTRQGLTARGDSGGPSLIFRDGRYYAVGMHSYISCLGQNTCTSPPDFDASLDPNSSWGEIAGDTRLSLYTDFVSTSIPEPSTWALVASALIFLSRKRFFR